MHSESPDLQTELKIEFVAPSRQSPAVLVVGGRATFRQAPALRRSLFEAISTTSQGPLMVDLSEVRRMDTASMAVLVEGIISTRDLAPEVLLCGPTERVRRVFRLAGLDEALGKCPSCQEEVLRMMEGGLA
ncbi:MAG: STAS domain-containing protein [Thermoanaerobaculia bacterium]